MKSKIKTYMVTVSRKPKGFKLVGNDIYEYDIKFKVEKTNTMLFPDYDCYTERISVPYKYFSKGTTKKTIDFLAFIRKVRLLTGVTLNEKVGHINTEVFRRDGALLTFVENIIVPGDQIEQYIQYRELRIRIEKINKLKDRI